jgi:hypothetical protein
LPDELPPDEDDPPELESPDEDDPPALDEPPGEDEPAGLPDDPDDFEPVSPLVELDELPELLESCELFDAVSFSDDTVLPCSGAGDPIVKLQPLAEKSRQLKANTVIVWRKAVGMAAPPT